VFAKCSKRSKTAALKRKAQREAKPREGAGGGPGGEPQDGGFPKELFQAGNSRSVAAHVDMKLVHKLVANATL